MREPVASPDLLALQVPQNSAPPGLGRDGVEVGTKVAVSIAMLEGLRALAQGVRVMERVPTVPGLAGKAGGAGPSVPSPQTLAASMSPHVYQYKDRPHAVPARL